MGPALRKEKGAGNWGRPPLSTETGKGAAGLIS